MREKREQEELSEPEAKPARPKLTRLKPLLRPQALHWPLGRLSLISNFAPDLISAEVAGNPLEPPGAACCKLCAQVSLR